MSLSVMFRLVCIATMMMAVAAASLSKPGCPKKCGNVTIPYPFGIGSECSANANFTLVCRNSTYPPKPFLTYMKSEVLRISLEGTLTVNRHVSPLNCSSAPETYLATSLLGTPFTIAASDYNSVLVLGCQNSITFHYSDGSTSGCTPICDADITNTNCSKGVNCCVATILSRLKELRYTYQSNGGVLNNNSFCGYAFPVESRWFYNDYATYKRLLNHPLNPFDPEFQYVPLVLNWEYETGALDSYINCEYVSYASRNPDSYLYHSKVCNCRDGFTGNPYLHGGCLDVDECSNSSLNSCPNGTCINTKGSFTCHDHPQVHLVHLVKIIFISIGSAFGALILFLVSWVFTKAIRKRIEARRRHKFFTRNGGLLLKQQLSTTDNGLDKTKVFGSKELSQATDHYNENRVLGRGGQGTVYKGMLTDGRIVAIKKSKRVGEADLKSFINEVVILSQMNHRNVVKLLGCCLETEVPLLVYEFIPNGTLLQHIQEPSEEFPLTWEIRLRIAREVAGALWYLHSAASAPIYHRDIKSTNILLDDKYRAIVSDFGTSRSVAIDETHFTTRVLGTFGYLDPEYFRSNHFTEKSDVYSFGVVMVELLTGEKAVSSVRAAEGKNLAIHFLHSMEENQLFEILDPRILTESPEEEIVAFAQLSKRCLHMNGKRRPTMREVVVELEGIHMPKQGSDSIFNEDDERDEEYGIDVDDESYDFSSVSESMHFEINSACPPNAERPLLDEP